MYSANVLTAGRIACRRKRRLMTWTGGNVSRIGNTAIFEPS